MPTERVGETLRQNDISASGWRIGWLAALLLIVAASWLAVPARAQEVPYSTLTVGDLLKHCRATVNAYAAGRNGKDVVPDSIKGSWNLGMTVGTCQGFIEGFWFASDLIAKSGNAVTLFNLVCLPDQVTTEKLTGSFVKWAEANPQRAKEASSTGVYRAWRISWPCSTTIAQ
jgi:hypothetical protein